MYQTTKIEYPVTSSGTFFFFSPVLFLSPPSNAAGSEGRAGIYRCFAFGIWGKGHGAEARWERPCWEMESAAVEQLQPGQDRRQHRLGVPSAASPTQPLNLHFSLFFQTSHYFKSTYSYIINEYVPAGPQFHTLLNKGIIKLGLNGSLAGLKRISKEGYQQL